MSRALVCDNCEAVLTLNTRGENVDGEDAAWLRLTITGDTFDLCTRACVVAFLDRPEVISAHDAYSESISGIARTISGADDEEEPS